MNETATKPSSKSSSSVRSMRLPILLALFVFTVTLILNAPASIIRLGLDRVGNDFQYRNVEGGLWKGTINGVYVGSVFLHTINYEWNPLSILGGGVTFHVDSKGGDATGQGNIRLGLFSKDMKITNANLIFNLNSIKQYTIYGVPYQGILRSKIRVLQFNQRECVKADVDLWTDAMTASAVKLSGDPLDLAGKAMCANEKMQVTLNGQSGSGQIAIQALVAMDLNYSMETTVMPRRTELQQALSLLGFQRKGDNYVYDTIGKLKGAGS